MDKQAYQKNLIDNVVSSIEKNGGKDCLSSIILTGSFGRGEPTFSVSDDGGLVLKSDVEIALVFPRSSQKNDVESIISKVSSEFSEDLNLMTVNESRVKNAYNFNFSLKSPKYKTIFTYDLFNGSKTVWGKDFIGEKKITLDDVDKYEAKRLVANRIGELVYLQITGNSQNADYLRIQWKGKLMLAIASGWLICENKYVSSYHGQFDCLKLNSTKADEDIGSDFFGEYSKVFDFLREDGELYEVSDEKLREYVKNINEYFKKNNIGTPKVNSVSRLVKYVVKYIKSGMKFGVFGFENKILQALIEDYAGDFDKLKNDAIIWHNVLY